MSSNSFSLTCSNCGYKWTYEGKMKYYATCPDCRHNQPIRELTKAHFDKVYGVGNDQV